MNEQNKQPTFWQTVQWPIIIVALLSGHVFFMLVAMSFALAGPPMEIPEQYGRDALGQPPARELVLPKPETAPHHST